MTKLLPPVVLAATLAAASMLAPALLNEQSRLYPAAERGSQTAVGEYAPLPSQLESATADAECALPTPVVAATAPPISPDDLPPGN